MAVQSRSLDPEDQPTRRRNPSALFRRGTFTSQQAGVKRFLAVLLFGISLVGAILWGGGGPAAWVALSPVWWGVVAAIVVQLLLTYGQWVFGGPAWWNPLYLGCWGASTLMTVLGYWPLAHGWLAGQLQALSAGPESTLGYYAPWLAGGIIVGVAALLDWIPEQTLLD